jgi:hypothetical protein
VGWVEGRHRDQMRGWAIDLAEPCARLTIEVVDSGGSLVARTLADRYRADVARAGHGDGYCGFAVACSRLEAVRAPRFLCAGLRTELKSAPSLDTPQPRRFERSGVLLHLDDQPRGGHATGWMAHRQRPAERRQLGLRAGDRLIARQRATLFRPDSLAEGFDGFQGFLLTMPTDGRPLLVEDLATGVAFRIG